jgi:putative spermidine/putrescine transport system ATP-binding protein
MLGITTIYVTHDQAEAMALGDRVVVMSKGAIAQAGTPRDIYFAPANRFVAEFVGAANLVEARAVNGMLTVPGGQLPIADANATGDVIAMIRPESISVVAPDAASLSGRVERVSFVGDRQRLAVSGATERPLMIDAPNTLDVKIGERVGLKVDPHAVRVLPGERA